MPSKPSTCVAALILRPRGNPTHPFDSLQRPLPHDPSCIVYLGVYLSAATLARHPLLTN
jgi:hypothetical protein